LETLDGRGEEVMEEAGDEEEERRRGGEEGEEGKEEEVSVMYGYFLCTPKGVPLDILQLIFGIYSETTPKEIFLRTLLEKFAGGPSSRVLFTFYENFIIPSRLAYNLKSVVPVKLSKDIPPPSSLFPPPSSTYLHHNVNYTQAGN
jgi:hypothetical protein